LDENSIRENVRFNKKFDCNEGFEDLGSQGRTCNIANHALLFMVHGLHRKWKQQVAYYLSRGSTKAEMLMQFLKEVLDACQNVGLRVVATVCDMDTNNVKTMKLLGSTTESHSSSFKIKKLQQYMTPTPLKVHP
jgi:hypothetical protein